MWPWTYHISSIHFVISWYLAKSWASVSCE